MVGGNSREHLLRQFPRFQLCADGLRGVSLSPISRQDNSRGPAGVRTQQRSSLPPAIGWGSVTLGIVNITDPLHFGLGQVLFADWYVNFGTAGVVFEGLVIGVLLKWLDVRLLQIRRPPKGAVSDQYFQLFSALVWCRNIGKPLRQRQCDARVPAVAGIHVDSGCRLWWAPIFGVRPGVGGGMLRQAGMSAILERRRT